MYFQNYEPNIVVCDIGTEFTKMGYVTQNLPSYYNTTSNQKNNYNSPVVHSKIKDIPSYLQLLDNIENFNSKDVIVTLNNEDRNIKAKTLEYLYENKLCDNLLFYESRICDLYSYGKTSGLIISLSGSVSVVAIVDGLIIKRRDEDFGGFDATQMVRQFCSKIDDYAKGRTSEIKFSNYIANEKAREIKEHIFYNSNTIYELGQPIDFADVKDKIMNLTVKKINKFVNEIVEDMDDELKYQMLANILLTGGCAEMSGIFEKITECICKTYSQSKVKINYEKKFHTFVGASVFGSLGSTRCFYIGSYDYEEFGVNILDRKNFEWIKY